ncbi:MAG: MFS transporter [Chloroflexi bacterium]|nr:MFS transporter [Chloroflexota bacterium]
MAATVQSSFSMPPHWMTRDGKLIIVARGLGTFAQGFVAVIIAIYLDMLGFGLVQIGLVLTAGLTGSAFFALLVGLFGDSLGRRPLMVGLTLLSAVAGAAFAMSDNLALILAIAFVGSLKATGGARAGAVQPLEQASLTETCLPQRRTEAFAVYSIVAAAATALGSLAAGLPALLQGSLGLSELWAFKAMFLGYALFTALGGLLYLLLSPSVEIGKVKARWTNPLLLPSRRLIFTLAGLFSVDWFAGGLLVQSLVSYWFFTRWGVALGSIGVIFFLSSVLAAISLWVAAWLGKRIGLINTMVFTHIPSSLFLIAIPFAPVAWLAVALWLARSALGQMDVPTRDSYIMAIVGPEERIAMASVTAVTRSVSMSVTPSVATVLWNAASASAPFIACGVMKIGYDLALFFLFRNVKPPEEKGAEARAAAKPGPEPSAG